MSSVLTEELGPRGRQRVRVATWAASALLLAFLVWLVARLHAEGQFAGRLWEQFLDFETEWPQFLLSGAWGTVRAAVGAMVIASVVGLFLALGRLSRAAPVRFVSGLIVDVFRGPPVLLWIFFSWLALPQLLPATIGNAISRQPLYALIIGLSAYNMAVLAEIYRAGILSLDRGQREAGMAVGLTHRQNLWIVILPQALRRMIPAIIAQLATLTKDTALGYIVTVGDDIMGRARSFAQGGPSNDLQTYFVVGVLYFVIVWGLTRLAGRLEVKQRRTLGGPGVQVGGGEADLDALVDEDATEVKD
ncbi:amino acid ABC transporter permease [Egicoccus halophilus]|uniref:Glutamate ABC transporter permease n=1 Tax=Egicoccus halophilus TaxID=1670830 RepID=A0A8J3ABM1_9ACTN|nr:amino acid ABC transporter permease [Egicoccus halophilus]GGI07638.1 glutamate ABC transporter permease [Egicoccus halophilus]